MFLTLLLFHKTQLIPSSILHFSLSSPLLVPELLSFFPSFFLPSLLACLLSCLLDVRVCRQNDISVAPGSSHASRLGPLVEGNWRPLVHQPFFFPICSCPVCAERAGFAPQSAGASFGLCFEGLRLIFPAALCSGMEDVRKEREEQRRALEIQFNPMVPPADLTHHNALPLFSHDDNPFFDTRLHWHTLQNPSTVLSTKKPSFFPFCPLR